MKEEKAMTACPACGQRTPNLDEHIEDCLRRALEMGEAEVGCAINDPNHDHDGLWWSAADELGAMGR